jgi:hypothetical protein
MLLTAMCPDAHSTGAEVLTATVTNTGPAVISKRTATIALTAATLMMIGTSAWGQMPKPTSPASRPSL